MISSREILYDKNSIMKIKIQTTCLVIFITHITNKGLVSRIYVYKGLVHQLE